MILTQLQNVTKRHRIEQLLHQKHTKPEAMRQVCWNNMSVMLTGRDRESTAMWKEQEHWLALRHHEMSSDLEAKGHKIIHIDLLVLSSSIPFLISFSGWSTSAVNYRAWGEKLCNTTFRCTNKILGRSFLHVKHPLGGMAIPL